MSSQHESRRIVLILNSISVIVAFLMHLPELIALSEPEIDQNLFPGIHWVNVGNEILFTYLSILLLFILNRKVFMWGDSLRDIGWKSVASSFIITLVTCNILGNIFVFLHHHLGVPAIDATLHHYLHPLRDTLIACLVTGTSYLYHQYQRSRRMLLENEQLRTENLLNQYETLKNQLNPHMLFNSLNTLYSLIRESPQKAQTFLHELSRFMRYSLHDNLAHTVTLKEEMEFVHSYIYLLQMRYEDNLQFDIDIAQEALSRHIPPMAVQMLVENSVKHNEISSRNHLTVYIKADADKLCISNPLQPKLSDTTGTGVGLANLSKRYRLLVNKEIIIEETENEFKVTLPLI